MLKIESGSLASPNVDLATGTTLNFNNGGSYSGAITGGGLFTRSGTGTTIYTGTATHTGGTVVENGTLQIGNGGTAGSIVGNITNNGTLVINRSGTLSLSSAISGSGGLAKSGSGRLVLSATNTYTGLTTIGGGQLLVNGSIAGAATVQSGGLLGGSGSIGGDVIVMSGGTLSPGNSPGQITLADGLTMNAGSTLLMEFSGTGAGMYDRLDVQGVFTAGGTLNLMLIDGFTPLQGASFTIFNGATPGFNAGSFTFTTNLGGGLYWDTSGLGSTGVVSVVPEPSTWALLSFGAGFVIYWRRKRA